MKINNFTWMDYDISLKDFEDSIRILKISHEKFIFAFVC
jgi:hypothetical protein